MQRCCILFPIFTDKVSVLLHRRLKFISMTFRAICHTELTKDQFSPKMKAEIIKIDGHNVSLNYLGDCYAEEHRGYHLDKTFKLDF